MEEGPISNRNGIGGMEVWWEIRRGRWMRQELREKRMTS